MEAYKTKTARHCVVIFLYW